MKQRNRENHCLRSFIVTLSTRREIALSLNTRCTCKHNDMFLTRKSISPGGLDDEHNRANEGQEKVTTGLAP